MFSKRIGDKVYICTEPTLKQNKAFLSILMEAGIDFTDVVKDFDFGSFLTAMVQKDLLLRLIQTMIVPEHETWSVEKVPLSVVESLTDTEIEQIFTTFFEKKKTWINSLISFCQIQIIRMILKATKESKVT